MLSVLETHLKNPIYSCFLILLFFQTCCKNLARNVINVPSPLQLANPVLLLNTWQDSPALYSLKINVLQMPQMDLTGPPPQLVHFARQTVVSPFYDKRFFSPRKGQI